MTRSRGLECDGCGRPVHIMEVHKYANRILCTECLAALEGSLAAPKKARTPFAAHLLGLAGLGLVLLDAPVVWIARENNWRVSDGVVMLIVALFVGGVGLVGLAAVVRNSAGKA